MKAHARSATAAGGHARLPRSNACRATVVLVLFGASQLLACERGPVPQFDHASFRPDTLQGAPFHSSPVVATPSEIRSSNERLWIKDAAQDPALHMLDLESGTLLESLGRKGEGPGDFGSSPEIHVAAGDTTGAIWTWDYALRRLTRFAPDSPYSDPIIVSVSNDATPDAAWRMVWPEPDRLIGIHPSESARFSLVSSNGKLIRTVPGAFLGAAEVPLNLRRKATMGGFYGCAWPGRGFAIIYLRVGRIEFYDRNAEFVRLANVPFPSDAFIANEDGSFTTARDRDYYRSCDVHNDHLYVAFSGRSSSAFDAPANSACEYLHVFNWEGELRRVYHLEPEIHTIDIPPLGGVLFGASYHDATIYRFQLPALDDNDGEPDGQGR